MPLRNRARYVPARGCVTIEGEPESIEYNLTQEGFVFYTLDSVKTRKPLNLTVKQQDPEVLVRNDVLKRRASNVPPPLEETVPCPAAQPPAPGEHRTTTQSHDTEPPAKQPQLDSGSVPTEVVIDEDEDG